MERRPVCVRMRVYACMRACVWVELVGLCDDKPGKVIRETERQEGQ